MVLDEPIAEDEVFQENGITFAIDKKLFERVKPIQIDFVETSRGAGYQITSSLQKSCGSCSCSD
jgi:Fe-S cluster assembly iron-binding protein IscA